MSWRDELPLHPIRALEAFEKWVIDCVGLINPPARHSHSRYNITTKDYLTRWAEIALVKDCTVDTTAQFIFDNIVTRFGCPRSLTSDQHSHFINDTIQSLLQPFMIQHHKRSPYHLQANGTVEAFNKILDKGPTKICSADRDDWDERIPTTLWAYCTTTKRLHKYTRF